MRVAVVASAMALRVGLRAVLGGLSEVDVVAEAARVDELPLSAVDVLVLAAPADFSPLESENAPAVLLLTDESNEVRELQKLSLPAWGVLSVDASENELEATLHALSEGLWVGAPVLLRELLRQPSVVEAAETDPLLDPLTRREDEVLQMMAQGLANKQIAARLGISEHTVKFHLSSLYAKLGVTSRTEAVRAGVKRGMVVL
jgi:DNA-binding NarL/FixJ family response regulator